VLAVEAEEGACVEARSRGMVAADGSGAARARRRFTGSGAASRGGAEEGGGAMGKKMRATAAMAFIRVVA